LIAKSRQTPEETTMTSFCDLSETEKGIVCEARQADIRLFLADTNDKRARHKGLTQDSAIDLDALRADRDTKIALALKTGLTLDQIDGRRSPGQRDY
jgi:hypothetical protein